MKLKHIIAAAAVMLFGSSLTSCEDMLKTETESYVDFDGMPTYNANDSLYSAMGVVSQLQKLGERYVILGEIRGDLVEVPASAPLDLQRIAAFDAPADNAYSSRRDYYSVINNCNIALNRLDTLITEHNRAVLLPEYVSIRSMRDWTYLQLGLTYGKAIWIDDTEFAKKGLSSLDNAEAEYPTVQLDDLIERIIADLTPYAAHETASYGTIDSHNSAHFFISPMLLLADLQLYRNNYVAAASLYHDYMMRESITARQDYGNIWATASASELATDGGLSAYISESLVEIPYSTSAGDYHPNLVNLTIAPEPQLLPASWWMKEMNGRTHIFARSENAGTSTLLEGDTRGEVRYLTPSTPAKPSAFSSAGFTAFATPSLITKFYNNAVGYSDVKNPSNPIFETGNQAILNSVVTYRIPHLYLRYAEAINRAGKPTMAFAVLKYGLRNEVVNNEVDPKIDPAEWEGREEWLNFEDSRFDSNRGIASRGLGLGVSFSKDYAIPELPTASDSIAWVEEQILSEMAAETAFEGNRFFDLLRMSRHQADPAAWFATKLSRRVADHSTAGRLADPASYFLK